MQQNFIEICTKASVQRAASSCFSYWLNRSSSSMPMHLSTRRACSLLDHGTSSSRTLLLGQVWSLEIGRRGQSGFSLSFHRRIHGQVAALCVQSGVTVVDMQRCYHHHVYVCSARQRSPC